MGHGKGDGYALHCFEEVQNCPTTGKKSRGGLRRCSFGTPGKEEFGGEGKGQQDAEEGHQNGPASEDAATGEGGGQTVADARSAGGEKEPEERPRIDGGREIRQTDCSHDSHLACECWLGPVWGSRVPLPGCFLVNRPILLAEFPSATIL